MSRPSLIVTVFMIIAMGAAAPAQEPAVVATPPLGWNSWNHFAGSVNNANVRAVADAMVANGMKAAGYEYINIDDTWEGKRDAQGFIHPNSKFPDMKALANYSSFGFVTC